jgi:hypothetical protein
LKSQGLPFSSFWTWALIAFERKPGLSPIDKKLFWRRQFLNPYAFESAPAALRALVELSSSPGSRLSPMNQQIRAFGKANTGHQLVRVPPTSAAMSIVRAFSITSAGSTLSRDPIRRAP